MTRRYVVQLNWDNEFIALFRNVNIVEVLDRTTGEWKPSTSGFRFIYEGDPAGVDLTEEEAAEIVRAVLAGETPVVAPEMPRGTGRSGYCA